MEASDFTELCPFFQRRISSAAESERTVPLTRYRPPFRNIRRRGCDRTTPADTSVFHRVVRRALPSFRPRYLAAYTKRPVDRPSATILAAPADLDLPRCRWPQPLLATVHPPATRARNSGIPDLKTGPAASGRNPRPSLPLA